MPSTARCRAISHYLRRVVTRNRWLQTRIHGRCVSPKPPSPTFRASSFGPSESLEIGRRESTPIPFPLLSWRSLQGQRRLERKDRSDARWTRDLQIGVPEPAEEIG